MRAIDGQGERKQGKKRGTASENVRKRKIDKQN